jgi:hypothetical protein
MMTIPINTIAKLSSCFLRWISPLLFGARVDIVICRRLRCFISVYIWKNIKYLITRANNDLQLPILLMNYRVAMYSGYKIKFISLIFLVFLYDSVLTLEVLYVLDLHLDWANKDLRTIAYIDLRLVYCWISTCLKAILQCHGNLTPTEYI